jgi:uncharacterized cupin superfamily protein
MPKIFPLNELKFQEHPVPVEAYKLKSVFPRMSDTAESKALYFNMRTLSPGKFSFPYHYHHNSEEVFVVIQGSMTLRTPEGQSIIKAGDVVFFETGEKGAHQLYNHSDSDCVYFDLGTRNQFDATEYPDTGKIAFLPQFKVYNKGEERGYFDNETDPDTLLNRFYGGSEKP